MSTLREYLNTLTDRELQAVEHVVGNFKPKDTENFSAVAICERAAELVGGDRAQQHGDKKENHQNIADLWSAFLNTKITAQQVALMMVLLKVARTKSGSLNRDDFVDMAGYSGIAAEIARGEE